VTRTLLAVLWTGTLLLGAGPDGASAASTDKTLVAWVTVDDLDQRGGSVLTIQSGDRFDAIVFGEKMPRRWMAGSNYFRRTEADQRRYPPETADPQTLVQIAIVYEGDRIRLYRNGRPYAAYRAKNIDLLGVENHIAVFGLRHIGAGTGRPFAGTVEDARIYARALAPAEIAGLRPNDPSGPKPLAWWDFEGDRATDRAGHFPYSAAVGGVRVADGRLRLDGRGYLAAARSEADAALATRPVRPRAPAPPYVPETPAWPADPPANWVTFHLAHPGPGTAFPGDPNCAFDYKGRYHLHYIYRNRTGFVFGHVSSDDLVHWTWHPTVLAPPTTGHGMFSGTGFFTKDGRPAIIYHGQGSGRNWIQVAQDDRLETWSAPEPVLPRTADGRVAEIRHWDPDCWRLGDTYYAVSGGKNPQLMKSTDLRRWTYLGDLFHEAYPPDLGVARDEDVSCPNMFRLGSRWMLLCISHRLGCRYYLGEFRDEKFLPRFHAMMSFGGRTVFAPESMETRDGRRVMWAWLVGLPIAPTGVQCLPRELSLPADGVLRIRPLRELASLRYDGKTWERLVVRDGAEQPLDGLTGDALEIEVVVAPPVPPRCGLRLLADAEGRDGLTIAVDSDRKTLTVGKIKAPLPRKRGEALTLRLFLDKNLVEVFADDRQAVVYAHRHVRPEPNVRLFAEGGDLAARVQAWKMRSIYHTGR